MMDNLQFSELGGTQITDDLLKECANLFSNNYGIWGCGNKECQNITLCAKRLKEGYLFNTNCHLVIAKWEMNSLALHSFVDSSSMKMVITN